MKISINGHQKEAIVTIVAMGLVGILELAAILKGWNGQMLMTAIGIICLLAGVMIPKPNLTKLFKKI